MSIEWFFFQGKTVEEKCFQRRKNEIKNRFFVTEKIDSFLWKTIPLFENIVLILAALAFIWALSKSILNGSLVAFLVSSLVSWFINPNMSFYN